MGDFNGWWEERSFLTNMLSAICGALFGIPVALIFLQQISTQQALLIEKRRTVALARKVINNLKVAVESLSPSGMLIAEEKGVQVRKHSEELERYALDRATDIDMQKIRIECQEIVDSWSDLSVMPGNSAAHIINEMQQKWTYFNQEIYTRSMESEIDWIPVSLVNKFDKMMETLNSFNEVSEGSGLYFLEEEMYMGGRVSDDLKDSHPANIHQASRSLGVLARVLTAPKCAIDLLVEIEEYLPE
ncbi:hypothetical protein ABGB12_17140 [Actinocorallia sp. B10E7]|uniref:hypothetical protein n=1 Tax=Actinocorallia sp. B10E7 TaxID=3153558 RepID=UPI00325DDA2B